MLQEPFLGSVAVAAGLVTESALRTSLYATMFRDVYVLATEEQDLELRSRGAALLLPEDGAVAGYAAAELHGAECAPANAPVEVIAPKGQVRKRRGLIVRQAVLAPAEVEVVKGVRCTTAFRTAWDLGRRLRLTEAVAAIDQLARVGEFDPRTLLNGPPGARGCRRLAEAVAYANPLADSAMESRLRMMVLLSGLPEPHVQYVLRDRWGTFVAQFDLAYPEAKLALEYDGEIHFDDDNARRDRRRDLASGDEGWLTMRFTSDDVYGHPKLTIARIRARLAERAGQPTPSRTTLA